MLMTRTALVSVLVGIVVAAGTFYLGADAVLAVVLGVCSTAVYAVANA
jgi:hypothetical protein